MNKTFTYVEVGTNLPMYNINAPNELQAYQILKRRLRKLGKDIKAFELIGD